jgi:virginiamycin A acetyltransferase
MHANLDLKLAHAKALRAERNCRSRLSPVFVYLYRFRWLRRVVQVFASRLEGGEMYSESIRLILKQYFNVEVGKYSYGSCMKPGYLPGGTTVGNYSSIASELMVFRRNHPVDRLSTHPFFYNHACGVIDKDSIHSDSENPLRVGHDVWIGSRVIILPKCRVIGNGAVVGAGSVLTKDVEPFSIVAGNPATLRAHRFSPDVMEAVAGTSWWNRHLPDLLDCLPVFFQSLPECGTAALDAIQRQGMKCSSNLVAVSRSQDSQ